MDERHPESSMLANYLAETDTPCPSCGYNLRGLTGNMCPECNQALVLRLSPAEPDFGTLVATLIPPIGAACCGSALLAFVLVISIAEKDPPPAELMLQLVGAPGSFAVVGTWAAFRVASPRGRRRFRSLTMSQRRRAAITTWASSILLFAAYIWWIIASLR